MPGSAPIGAPLDLSCTGAVPGVTTMAGGCPALAQAMRRSDLRYTPYQIVKYMSFWRSIWNASLRATSTAPGSRKSTPGSVRVPSTFIAETLSSAAPTPCPQTSST